MKKSIFRRLLITYLITALAGHFLMAVLLLSFFNSYSLESRKDLMLYQGERISLDIVEGLRTGRFDEERMGENLQMLDRVMNARIWLVDYYGYVIGASGSDATGILGRQVSDGQLSRLREEGPVFRTGSFDQMLQEPSLSLMYPIVADGAFQGGLLIHAPLSGVRENFMEMYRLAVLGISLSLILAIGVLLVQARRISAPVKVIGRAAREIAGGAFGKRLDIRTQDEIQELAESFNHMAASLAGTEENRRRLISNISHDIRTPVTSIRGFAGGILDGTIPPEEQSAYLERIREESDRLMKITSDLLELDRLREGVLTPQTVTVDLHELIRRTLAALEPAISQAGLLLEASFGHQPEMVLTDPALLERILMNLLDNAVKFSPEGETLRVSTRKEGSRVLVEVANTGVHLEAEELNRIWERFHKADASRNAHRSGFGLGLAIVRQLAVVLEEEIRAESSGNEVRFIFSVKRS